MVDTYFDFAMMYRTNHNTKYLLGCREGYKARKVSNRVGKETPMKAKGERKMAQMTWTRQQY